MKSLPALIESSRLSGQIFCRTIAHSPWCVQLHSDDRMMLHVITEGACVLELGESRLDLSSGDLVLLPHPVFYVLYDSPDSLRTRNGRWCTLRDKRGIYMRQNEGEEPHSRFFCGGYSLEEGPERQQVLRMLPRIIHLPRQLTERQPELQSTLRSLLREVENTERVQHPIMSRLMEVLLLQLLRTWTENSPEQGMSMSETQAVGPIENARALMHASPHQGWSLESLSAAVGISRSLLARRFTEQLGEPPLTYLTRLRMDLAVNLLESTDVSISRVAELVGYTSEFAFNRAFKRWMGAPPGRFRKQRGLPQSTS